MNITVSSNGSWQRPSRRSSGYVGMLIAAIFFALIAAALFVTSLSITEDLIVTEEFNGEAYFASSTDYMFVSGEIENNTGRTLYNVTLKVTLECDYEDSAVYIEEEIGDLEAGERYYLADVYGSKYELYDLEYYATEIEYKEGEWGDYICVYSAGSDANIIIGIVFSGVAAVLLICFFIMKSKHKKRMAMQENQPSVVIRKEIIENVDGTRIETQVQPQTFTNTSYNGRVNQVQSTPTTTTPPTEKYVKCGYCGTKNSAGSTKCSGCGSNLD